MPRRGGSTTCCGCPCSCFGPILAFFGRSSGYDMYAPLLLEDERDAVTHLLQHIEHPHPGFLEGESLRALRTLSYSDNVDLQRSAALTFAEVTSSGTVILTEAALEPIISLAHSPDVGVQRASSAALGNLALHDENKLMIVEMGGITALVQLLHSANLEVQCNACGCITNLATNDINKTRIAQAGALGPLVRLANSHDQRVQRNATGALLNLTHIEGNRKQLVQAGAVPIIISLLASADSDVQYYSAAALSNLAVDDTSRWSIVQYNGGETFSHLVRLLSSSEPKVQCQACLCLRNLASEEEAQLAITERGGLAGLLPLLQSESLELISAAVAAVRNLSIHRQNEAPIVRTGYISVLTTLLMRMWRVAGHGTTPPFPVDMPSYINQSMPSYIKPAECDVLQAQEIECHVAGIVRNIAATEDYRMLLYEDQIIPLLGNVMWRSKTNTALVTEASAALSVLCQHDALKYPVCRVGDGALVDLLIGLVRSGTEDIQINAANCLSGLASGGHILGTHSVLLDRPGLLDAVGNMLRAEAAPLIHVGLWLTFQLSKGDEHARRAIITAALLPPIKKFTLSGDKKTKQLATAVLANLMPREESSPTTVGGDKAPLEETHTKDL